MPSSLERANHHFDVDELHHLSCDVVCNRSCYLFVARSPIDRLSTLPVISLDRLPMRLASLLIFSVWALSSNPGRSVSSRVFPPMFNSLTRYIIGTPFSSSPFLPPFDICDEGSLARVMGVSSNAGLVHDDADIVTSARHTSRVADPLADHSDVNVYCPHECRCTLTAFT